MKKIKIFLKNHSVIYKTAFCICSIILCFVAASMDTEKNEQSMPVAEGVSNTEVLTDSDLNDIKDNTYDQITGGTSMLYESEAVDEIIPQLSFVSPVYGNITKEYSPSVLMYSKTLDDWRIHTGVDIACDIGSEVYAACDGEISAVGYDVNYGNYVFVKNGGLICRYFSLSAQQQVSVGQTVNAGQIIGYSSDSCISEICDVSHIHFEMTENSEYVNPRDYIVFD